MRNRGNNIAFSGLLSFAALPFLAITAENNSFAISIWLYLSLAVFFAVLLMTFMFHWKKKKNSLRLKKLQSTLTTMQQTLTALTEEREEIIQQRAKALQKELELLKKNLKAMEETLEATRLSAKRNSLLMTNISNTLRTNLNDILGFSSLLGNEFALSEESELYEFNENIRRSGEALMHLLNNIIDISKIESKSFNLNETECNLTDITRELIQQYQPAAEQKGVHIVYQDDEVPLFAADSQAVRHILANLLDNAVRYTDKGFIKISQTFNGKEIVWAIKDTGMGIDKAYLPDIFEPFRQQTLGYSKTTYQGAGLGLPLIKNMLDIMGGNIELESEKAVGTTVRIYLPYKKYVPASKKSKPKKTVSKPTISQKTALKDAGKRILVLDEDKLENMLIKKILTGATVETYDNSYPPVEWMNRKLKNQPLPDIIMVELDFSGKLKGPELLQEIRKKFPETDTIPAIALSSYPDVNGEEKALKAGFSAYLQKPFRKNDLISLINLFL